MTSALFALETDFMEQQVLPALAKAHSQASLRPLEGMLPKDVLKQGAHILTGRRYLLFGPEERKLIGIDTLLRQVLREHAQDTFPRASRLRELAQELQRSPHHGEASGALRRALLPDAEVPPWLQTGSGPGILPPALGTQLAAALREAITAHPLTEAPDLEAIAQDLAAFLEGTHTTGWDVPMEPRSKKVEAS